MPRGWGWRGVGWRGGGVFICCFPGIPDMGVVGGWCSSGGVGRGGEGEGGKGGGGCERVGGVGG